MIRAIKLKNGNWLVPRRAEGDNALRGDGWQEVPEDDADAQAWAAWYKGRGEEPPGEDAADPDAEAALAALAERDQAAEYLDAKANATADILGGLFGLDALSVLPEPEEEGKQ